MASFTAGKHAEAVVRASQQEIWDVLRDPDLMARFTPFLQSITETRSGEGGGETVHWVWQMTGLDVPGIDLKPRFTEKMVFAEPDRIDFTHDPPTDAGAKAEKASVEGWYELSPADDVEPGATNLVIDLQITVDLPVPKVAGGVVRTAMARVVDQMGDRFSANLLKHLGTTQV
ncbi:SRPBCC family protein [Nocardioides flavescens]|uniref:Polyketide cyclase / dehydrase and lipid transport n=1 Tax=Nocardioides flavescens TaxID=2691959 RepID=A0A6L7EZ19_9ACTN|nr:SRPBCC family protein [Nocardioides flavescens]MXG91426.1 hypothetical protein [Nocardioides flavescens]